MYGISLKMSLVVPSKDISFESHKDSSFVVSSRVAQSGSREGLILICTQSNWGVRVQETLPQLLPGKQSREHCFCHVVEDQIREAAGLTENQ